MTKIKVTVPDMGDFKDVEIIEVLVKNGQTINKNDSLITLESDKSSVEVPSTHSGKVEKINVAVGKKRAIRNICHRKMAEAVVVQAVLRYTTRVSPGARKLRWQRRLPRWPLLIIRLNEWILCCFACVAKLH